MDAQNQDGRPTTGKSVTVSRRRFLQAAGAAGLTVAWSMRRAAASGRTSGMNGSRMQPHQDAPPQPPTDVDSYLTIHEDGTITLATGKVEFGQGIQTGFAQLAAEELEVPFESIVVVMGITDRVPYDGTTAGSSSTRRTGVTIRRAAAEMREWLRELGADSLGVSVDEVVAENGAIAVRGDGDRSVSYADLAAGKQAVREIDEATPLKDPADYTIVGQDIPRVDVPAKVTGDMIYSYDKVVPDMVHGVIVRPPAIGATLESIDFSAAEEMPGVVGVFHEGDFAGLAAERRDQAEAALAAVRATWTEVSTGNTSENIYELLRETADEGQVLEEEPGDPESTLGDLTRTVSGVFRTPYVSHSPIEPKAALVQIKDDRVDVWTATQSPFRVQTTIAELLGRAPEEVVVTTLMAGGAFGSKTAPDAEVEAARLAEAFGRPVRIQWTRHEEIQFARFRPAIEIEVHAGLDDEGALAAWDYTLYSAGYYPEGAENPTPCAANASAAIGGIYDVANAKTTWYQGHSPLNPHFWRGNGAVCNAFAREVMLDELAELAGVTPAEFRSQLLGNNPRMQGVLDAVIEKAGWQPGVGSTGEGFGLALGFGEGTWVAEVAQVAVDESTGKIRVKHVDVAVDCGLVVNPEAARHQIEGSVVLALSPTLREEIKFENGKVTNATFGQYKPITFSEVPSIDTVFVEDKSNPMQGIGEPAVQPLTAAVSNAVYDLLGIRLREIPFTPARVLEALEAR